MDAHRINLRILRHPIIITSVICLLINDHLLKPIAPSYLTGKISDFAGLFFFPFLLMTLLSLLLDRLKVTPHRTAVVSFLTTLIWFSLIKVWAPANALTASVISSLLGTSVSIALDPTDLAALSVLLPAWLLWRRQSRQLDSQPPGKAAYFALGLATLATLATAPCLPQARITSLAVDDENIYAGITSINGEMPTEVASSRDGEQWNTVESEVVPEAIFEELQQPVQFPVIACEPTNSRICYRIQGAEQIDGSTDGGVTWQAVWQIPAGRRQFMERYQRSILLNCKSRPDNGPYDLALLPVDGVSVLVASMGNEGVLIHNPDDTWQRYGIMNAEPTPFSGVQDHSLLMILLGETVTMFTVGLFTWIVFTIGGTLFCLSKTRLPESRPVSWALTPAWLGFGLMVASLGVFFVMLGTSTLSEGLMLLLLVVGGAAILVGPAITWHRARKLSSQPVLIHKAKWVSLFAALGVFPLAWLPFVGWVYWIISWYTLAMALAWFIGAAALVLAIYWTVRSIRKEAGSSAPGP